MCCDDRTALNGPERRRTRDEGAMNKIQSGQTERCSVGCRGAFGGVGQGVSPEGGRHAVQDDIRAVSLIQAALPAPWCHGSARLTPKLRDSWDCSAGSFSARERSEIAPAGYSEMVMAPSGHALAPLRAATSWSGLSSSTRTEQ